MNILHRTTLLLAPAFILIMGLSESGTIQAQQFEGTLTYSVQAQDVQQDFVYFMKGNVARVEMEVEEMGGKAVILFNSEEEKMTMLMDQLNMYMEIPLTNDEEPEDVVDSENFQLTGETKTIAGVECQQYVFTDEDGSVTQLWTPIEEDFGSFLFPGMSTDMSSMVQPDMPSFSLFPFLIVNDDEGESVRMEVVAVQEQNLDDGLFSVPSNYREMNMGMFGN